MSRVLLVSLLALPAGLLAQDRIPPGTILPVRLNASISSGKSKPGRVITARIMQDVLLGSGQKIRVGSKVVGHVVDVSPASSGGAGRISFQFDRLVVSKETIPVITNLRALASLLEVDEAQLPMYPADRGTSSSAWTTNQIGGGEVVYRGGGPVARGDRVVGEPVPNGVLARVSVKEGAECHGAVVGNDQPQALWLFASDACGVFGYPRVRIVHVARTDPIGEIVLTSTEGDVLVRGGSGMLLRVNTGNR